MCWSAYRAGFANSCVLRAIRLSRLCTRRGMGEKHEDLRSCPWRAAASLAVVVGVNAVVHLVLITQTDTHTHTHTSSSKPRSRKEWERCTELVR